jgi:PAS domain S-box-containing protein
MTDQNPNRSGGQQTQTPTYEELLARVAQLEQQQLATFTERDRHSRAQLEAALASMTDAVFISDIEGRFIEFNDAFATFHRFPNKDACAKTLLEYSVFLDVFMADGTLAPLDQWAVPRALRGEQATNIEYTLRRKDTGETWAGSYSFAPIRDAGGEIVGSVVVGRDITEQKRAEAALRDSERLYRAIGESIDYGVWVCAPDGRNIYASESFLKLVGMTQEECSNFGWGDVLHPEDAERTLSAWKECVRTQGRWDIEHRFRGVDGQWHPILARGVAVKNEKGEVICWAGINLDISGPKEVEEALRHSEERFRTMVNAIPQLAWMAKADGYIHWYNERWYEYTGTTPEQMEGWGWQSVHDPKQLPKVLDRWQASIATSEPFEMEFPLRGAEGRFRRFLTRVLPLKDSEGKVVQWFGTGTDVTEMVEIQAALRRARDFSAAVVDTASALIVVLDPDGRITRFNRASEIVTGYSAAEVVGRGWEFLILPEQLSTVQRAWESRAGGGFPNAHENYWVAKDGSLRLIAWSNTAITGPGGNVEYIVCAGVDISERRRAEEAVRASEERFRRTLENMLEGCAILSPDWTYLFVNNVNAQHAHSTPQRMHGRNILEVIPGVEESPFFVAYRRCMEERTPQRVEAEFRFADGSSAWYEAKAEPVPEGIFVLSQDITERKRAEELLQRANEHLQQVDRQKNQFLAVLSHELRNPLTPIRNSLFILDRAVPGGEQANRAKAVIERQVSHLARLVDDLLDVTRIVSGKLRIQRARFDLESMLLRTADDHRAAFADAGIDFEVRVYSGPVWIEGDETRLAQACGNLLGNAVKFTQRGGRVMLTLELDAPTQMAIIRVRDTGVGVHPDLLPRVFEPFVQADDTLDRSKSGLGLGLALVKSVIELHGGTVDIESQGLGTGVEFIVRLPVEAQAILPLGDPKGPPSRPPPRRILLIEDNADAADSLRDVLELGSHQVKVAYSGAEGLEVAKEFKPEVVLCDIGLPGMSGYEVARALRADETLRSAHLVALTGYALPEDLGRAAEAGFDHHLAKPPSPEKLQELLAQLARPERE